jgi:hypothetical protein
LGLSWPISRARTNSRPPDPRPPGEPVRGFSSGAQT